MLFYWEDHKGCLGFRVVVVGVVIEKQDSHTFKNKRFATHFPGDPNSPK